MMNDPLLAGESSRKIERLELVQRYLSVLIAIASFWIVALSWNYYGFGVLEPIPRIGFGGALSWVVFLHAEAIGMLIMSMMKEKWQAEARELRVVALEAQARAQEAEARERDAQARLELQEREAQLREQAAELRMREAQFEARETQAREAQAREREARAQETIRDLRRRLEAAEGANGGIA